MCLDRFSQLVLHIILDRKGSFTSSTKRVTKTSTKRRRTTSRVSKELPSTTSSRDRPLDCTGRYGMEVSNCPRSKHSSSSPNRTSYRRLLRTSLPKHSSPQRRLDLSFDSREQRQLSDDFSLRKRSTKTYHQDRTRSKTSRTQLDVLEVPGCVT